MVYAADEQTTISPPRGGEAAAELDRLGDEIAELAAHLHAATYQLLVRLRVLDEQGGWGGGFRSCAHWLSWRTAIGLGTAREHVRVARALGALPQLSEAMRRGQLSFAKIRALTRIATPDNEKQLLELARQGTASHIEKVVSAWRRVDRLEEQRQECERHRARDLTLYHDDDGTYVIRGRLDPEVGALLDRALAAASEALYGRRESAGGARKAGLEDGPAAATAGQRRADAIALIAECAMRHGLDADTRAEHETAAAAEEDKAAENARASKDRGSNTSSSRSARQSPPPVADANGHGPASEDQSNDDRSGIAAHHPTPASAKPAAQSGGLPYSNGAARNGAPSGVMKPAQQIAGNVRGHGATPSAAAPCRPQARRASTVGRAERFQVVVHVDAEALRTGSAAGQSVLASGVRIPAETSRRLACDASRVVMAHDAEGNVLGVGRRTRTVPPAIRRALDHRDQGCRFPGCGLRYCDAHHITHWADGGATKLDNLAMLCRRHHRAVHEEGFRIQLTESGELGFLRPDGQPLPEVPAAPQLPDDPVASLAAEHRASGLEIDASTAMSWWMGERLDLDFALLTLRGPQHLDQRT